MALHLPLCIYLLLNLCYDVTVSGMGKFILLLIIGFKLILKTLGIEVVFSNIISHKSEYLVRGNFGKYSQHNSEF